LASFQILSARAWWAEREKEEETYNREFLDPVGGERNPRAGRQRRFEGGRRKAFSRLK